MYYYDELKMSVHEWNAFYLRQKLFGAPTVWQREVAA